MTRKKNVASVQEIQRYGSSFPSINPHRDSGLTSTRISGVSSTVYARAAPAETA
jgi:tetrahydromethanopterin S-methyltransferase subunit F